MNTQYTPEQQAIRQWLSKPYPMVMGGGCCCIGPVDNAPVCPCTMQFVERVGEFFYKVDEHRSPDGVTHTAKIIAEVSQHLTLEERLMRDLNEKVKEVNDTKGFTFAVKEYRSLMYARFNITPTLKQAVDHVRAMV